MGRKAGLVSYPKPPTMPYCYEVPTGAGMALIRQVKADDQYRIGDNGQWFGFGGDQFGAGPSGANSAITQTGASPASSAYSPLGASKLGGAKQDVMVNLIALGGARKVANIYHSRIGAVEFFPVGAVPLALTAHRRQLVAFGTVMNQLSAGEYVGAEVRLSEVLADARELLVWMSPFSLDAPEDYPMVVALAMVPRESGNGDDYDGSGLSIGMLHEATGDGYYKNRVVLGTQDIADMANASLGSVPLYGPGHDEFLNDGDCWLLVREDGVPSINLHAKSAVAVMGIINPILHLTYRDNAYSHVADAQNVLEDCGFNFKVWARF